MNCESSFLLFWHLYWKFFKKNIHKFESIFSNQSKSLWAFDSEFPDFYVDTVCCKEEWFEYFNYISLNRPFHWKVKYFGTINLLLSYLCTKGQVLAGSVAQASCLCLKVATTKEENNYPQSSLLSFNTLHTLHSGLINILTLIPQLDICSHRPLKPQRVTCEVWSEMLLRTELLPLIHRIIR